MKSLNWLVGDKKIGLILFFLSDSDLCPVQGKGMTACECSSYLGFSCVLSAPRTLKGEKPHHEKQRQGKIIWYLLSVALVLCMTSVPHIFSWLNKPWFLSLILHSWNSLCHTNRLHKKLWKCSLNPLRLMRSNNLLFKNVGDVFPHWLGLWQAHSRTLFYFFFSHF